MSSKMTELNGAVATRDPNRIIAVLDSMSTSELKQVISNYSGDVRSMARGILASR